MGFFALVSDIVVIQVDKALLVGVALACSSASLMILFIGFVSAFIDLILSQNLELGRILLAAV